MDPPHRGLLRKHVLAWSALVSALLLASGAAAAWFAYVDTLRSVHALQREKAQGVATEVGHFFDGIERPLRWVATSPAMRDAARLDDLRIELLQLLARVPALSELRWIDADGREQISVSRYALEAIGSGRDFSDDPRFALARRDGSYTSAVYFHLGTEPYLTLALPARRGGPGPVLAAEVNLKFIGEVISKVRIGDSGIAYVVDGGGRLLSHPDLSAVLRRTDLSKLPQVQAALAGATDATSADNPAGEAVFATAAPVPRLGWHVVAEQRQREALVPVLRSLFQSAALIVLGIAASIACSVVLARRLVRPIRQLQSQAAAIGAGRLDERIHVATGDELQALGEQFNQMAGNLQQIYATLEARIAERTQQLALANEAKSRFLAVASHDLRQPMHALGLFVGQLRGATRDETARALVSRIDDAVGSLQALLDALLDISRLDAGTVEVNRAPFALGALLVRVGASFAPAAAEKGLRLKVVPTCVRVNSDPLLVERIVINLLGNAIRYTDRGTVLLGVRRRAGGVAELVVADSGIGIDAEHLPHVFREFYQAGHHADRGKGLGLGLAIVDRLARLLGHPLRVHSRPGQGSMFGVVLPLAEAAAEVPVEVPADHEALLDGVRVLVIDDDAPVREAMRGQLEQWGCEVALAAGGDAALASVRERGAPDLLLCDLRLNDGEDGVAVVARVQAACDDAPAAVLITAETAPAALRAAQASGCQVLHKPIKPARLRALLEHLLAERVAAVR